MSDIICGWYNTQTGESGKFNKDGKPIKYNLLDKIKLWWYKRTLNNSLYNLKESVNESAKSGFVFSGTVRMNKLYNGRYIGEEILSIYVNNSLQLARTQSNEYIDYNAWQQFKQISYID